MSYKLIFSYSDRARYYLGHPKVAAAHRRLLDNLGGGVPDAVISQYLPECYQAVRAGASNRPEDLSLGRVSNVIAAYFDAGLAPRIVGRAIGEWVSMNGAAPLVEMKHIYKQFGGVHAVEDVSIDLHPGEIVGVLGHNGAGKSCLMRILSGAMPRTSGEIFVDGNKAEITTPIEARNFGIETIYQTLALADHLDAPANLFLGRELKTKFGTLDKKRMEEEARKVLQRLNPNFKNITDIVRNMSGGQRQVIAIARALYFNARILIMDEPTAALGPSETKMVDDLMRQLRNEGIGIFLISHDIHDVYALCDRVMVMKNGVNVGMHAIDEVTQDDILSLIILSRLPEDWRPRNLPAD